MVKFVSGLRLRPSMVLPDLRRLCSIQHISVSEILPTITKVVFAAVPVLLFLYKSSSSNLKFSDCNACLMWLFTWNCFYVCLPLVKPPPPEVTSSHHGAIEIQWDSICVKLHRSVELCDVRYRTEVDQDWIKVNLVCFFLTLFTLSSTRYIPDCWL